MIFLVPCDGLNVPQITDCKLTRGDMYMHCCYVFINVLVTLVILFIIKIYFIEKLTIDNNELLYTLFVVS